MKLIYPEAAQGIVSRMKNSIFSYQAWPTVARDEKGTLYAVASDSGSATSARSERP